MAVHHLEEMAVQMDGVGTNHRIVDEHHTRAFVAFETDRLDAFAELFAVERPHEALHVAGKVNLDRALRRARVWIGRERHQVSVGQHLVADVFQPDARVTGAVDRRHGDGVHADADLDAVGHLRFVAHVHAAHRMGTAVICCCRAGPGGHGAMVHSRH